MRSRFGLAHAAIALTVVALAACGGSTPSASNPTTPPASAKAACTLGAVLVPIQAAHNKGGNQATVDANSSLLCTSGIARIRIVIGPVNPPAIGPQGLPHLVLLEDQSGQWVIANDKLCNSAGQPTRAIPAKLGTVCGVQ